MGNKTQAKLQHKTLIDPNNRHMTLGDPDTYSSLCWWMTQCKLKDRTQGTRQRETASWEEGKQSGLMNQPRNIMATRVRFNSKYLIFLIDRLNWEIPHQPQVHEFIWIPWTQVFNAKDSNSIWFEFNSFVLSTNSATHKCFVATIQVIIEPSLKLG